MHVELPKLVDRVGVWPLSGTLHGLFFYANRSPSSIVLYS